MTGSAEEERPEIQDLRERKEKALLGGGEERIAKQHGKGRMTARERIEKLLDAGSFVETDMLVTHMSHDFGMEKRRIPGDGVITGYGNIDGRTICIFSQDFTVFGGTLGAAFASKVCKIMDFAMRIGVPVIGLNDSGGARIQEGVESLKGYGDIFYRNTLASGVIPQISAIMGPCAGGAVYSPAATDFIFFVEGAHMFITGPKVVKAITGEDISFEALGGIESHTTRSGVAHFACLSDQECLDMIRSLISYLPLNNMEDPPYVDPTDDPERISPNLNTTVPQDPNKPYDMFDVLGELFDNGEIFEVSANFAQNIITAFSRLEGRVVGIIASQPLVLAGVLDIDASDKICRFVRFCDAFNIPIITFQDIPGFLPGSDQEYGGIIRHGAKIFYAYSEATVPLLTVITRKAYGGGYIVLASRHVGADFVFAWPTTELAVMGPEGAADIMFRREIAAAEDSEAMRTQKIDEYREKFANPYIASELGIIDDVIEPQETRPRLIKALKALDTKRTTRPPKKHGNIPV